MVHDGNKDEAEKCFNLAQKYFKEGSREKAIRFTQKAERLYPTQKAQGVFFCRKLKFILASWSGGRGGFRQPV